LRDVASNPVFEWAERIESKGYLLLTHVPSKALIVKRAIFAIEQAKSKKFMLERNTKVETLEKLNNGVAKARTDEVAKKAVYDEMRARPAGFMRWLIRRKAIAT
jgi:hypothetical protein